MSLENLEGWFPVDVRWEPNSPIVEWRYLGSAPFEEPFFFQTLARVSASDPGRAPLHTSINVLEKFEDINHNNPPTGFVFHMSRCGSTLVTRLLSCSERNLVLSEPDAINKLLGAPATFPKELRIRWLRGLIRALDQRQSRFQKHFFIKFSSWNILELNFIKSAFPDVPCCFLFRDPVEVMVSLLNDPPAWLTAILNFERSRQAARKTSAVAAMMTPEECSARFLANFCRSALESPGQETLFLNYRSLPSAVWKSLASHFQISFTSLEIERMNELAKVNAKDIHGVQKFEGDSTIKQRKATDLIRELASTWVSEPFGQLERRASGFD